MRDPVIVGFADCAASMTRNILARLSELGIKLPVTVTGHGDVSIAAKLAEANGRENPGDRSGSDEAWRHEAASPHLLSRRPKHLEGRDVIRITV